MRYSYADEYEQAAERNRLYGVYPAQVTDIKDPDGQGRVKVKLPWSPDDDSGYEVWARLVTPMAGNQRGLWFVPDVNDEVLVVFESGDPRRPHVIGASWNGRDNTPVRMDGAGNNYTKAIVSRRNIRITLDDTEGRETLTLETPGGQKIILQDGPGTIEMSDSSGNSVKMESAGVTITAASKLTIRAGTIEVNAGMVTVNSGMSKFSGIVKSDVVSTNSVISLSYTPGAGNIW